jgi:hypothetical protein
MTVSGKVQKFVIREIMAKELSSATPAVTEAGASS